MESAGQRIAFDAGLLALLVLAAAAVAADVPVLRPVSVLLAMLLVPGGALLTRLRVDDPASAAGIAVGLSIAVDTVLAAAMAAAHTWSPWALAGGLALPATLLLTLDLQRAITGRRADGVIA